MKIKRFFKYSATQHSIEGLAQLIQLSQSSLIKTQHMPFSIKHCLRLFQDCARLTSIMLWVSTAEEKEAWICDSQGLHVLQPSRHSPGDYPTSHLASLNHRSRMRISTLLQTLRDGYTDQIQRQM